MGRKKKKGSASAASRLVVTFDEEKRREYLTGFHKRKVERRKVALEEIKRKLKEEQRKMKEERHKEYLKMLREREEALVTTISDLDLSGARQLGLTTSEGKSGSLEEEKGEEVVNKPARTMPKKSRNPFLSEKMVPSTVEFPMNMQLLCPFLLGCTGLSCCLRGITLLQYALVPKHFSLPLLPRISSLTATLHMHSRKKKKGKQPQRGQGSYKKIQKPSMRRTTKTQRRRLTGKMGRDQD
ncbi:hypothetical protein ASZ78_014434 [Callipepla squamata]|uniref:Nucleolar protein 12 n=1 Tax=Callipepla squamata TaxID=9009 RepID=A0A226N044_CALSU|nr:hypothetical protein ASZ78_014434 [Callipepla squamata]